MTDKNLTDKNDLDTKARILDASERLFAERGYKRTTIRAVATEANVNIAATNYHFGAKQALLEAVMQRKIGPLNKIRMDRIKNTVRVASEEGKAPLVTDVLRDMFEPTIECSEDAEHFMLLLGRIFTEQDGTMRRLFHRFMMPVIKELSAGMKIALPHLDDKELMIKLHFAIGAMAHAIKIRNMPMKHIPMDISNTEELTEMLVRFTAAGMEA